MAKLKERQFFDVTTRRRELVPADYITVVIFKNGAYALKGQAKYGNYLFKIISDSKVTSMERKYGKAKRYSRR